MQESNILFYAYRNVRNRFFIPSKENYFGIIKCDFVMIDSGCNTLLIPLQKGDIYKLYNEYPTTDYKWTISESHGVASVKSLVLSINCISGISKDINITIAKDLYNWNKINNMLRFHLSQDDILELNSIISKLILDKNSLNKLNNYIKNTNDLKNICNRREHALFGQSFLNNICSIQVNDLLIGFNNINNLENIKSIIINLTNKRTELITNDKFPEFNDLVDDDHGNEYNSEDEFIYNMTIEDYKDD